MLELLKGLSLVIFGFLVNHLVHFVIKLSVSLLDLCDVTLKLVDEAITLLNPALSIRTLLLRYGKLLIACVDTVDILVVLEAQFILSTL